eukprot:jgi/Psemu1/307013/fgenesh1_kg.297_\
MFSLSFRLSIAEHSHLLVLREVVTKFEIGLGLNRNHSLIQPDPKDSSGAPFRTSFTYLRIGTSELP